MASTQTWSEFNGSGGTTETTSRGEANWKAIDDSTTAYTSSPVVAGTNSFDKNQCIVFAGTWNSLSALTYACSNNSQQSGNITIVAAVVTSAHTASATATGAGAWTSTLGANFNTSSSPYGAGTTASTASGTMYANVVRSQLQTSGSPAPGDITSCTITASWTES